MTTLFKAPTSPANASYVTMAIQGNQADIMTIEAHLDRLGYVSAKTWEQGDKPMTWVTFYDVAVKELPQFEKDYMNACEGM